MSRRSTAQKKLDESRYPVRVRVAVPPDGFGATLDEMHAWLRREVGLYRYASHGASAPNEVAFAADPGCDWADGFHLDLFIHP